MHSLLVCRQSTRILSGDEQAAEGARRLDEGSRVPMKPPTGVGGISLRGYLFVGTINSPKISTLRFSVHETTG